MGGKCSGFRVGAVVWGRRWLAGAPVVAVGPAMFFLCMRVGGSGFSSLGLALMFMARSYAPARIPASAWVVQGVCMLLAALLGVCATFYYPLCLILNFTVMFAIIYFCGNEFLPKAYFAPGYAFIMMQMYRHTPGDLPAEALSCVLGLVVAAAFAFVKQHVGKKPGEPESFLRRACALLGEQLQAGSGGCADTLTGLVNEYARSIYGDVHKQNGLLNAGQSWHMALLLYLEQLGCMAEDGRAVGKGSRAYFEELAALFTRAGGDWADAGGQTLGMPVFLPVTEFLPGEPTTKMLWVLFVGFSLIFSTTDQTISMLIGTQMSVQALWPRAMGMGQAMGARLGFILAAAAVVWIGGLLVLRTERHDAVHFYIKSLLFSYEKIVEKIGRFLAGGEPIRYTLELLLRARMTACEIEALAGDPAIPGHEDLREIVLPSCHAFRVEMTHALLLCHRADLSERARAYFLGEVETLKAELEGIRSGVAA